MTASNTYDHVQKVNERLASIQPQEVLSQTQAQEVVTQQANQRGAMPMPEVEGLPGAWEIGRSAEGAVDTAAGAVIEGLGVVLDGAAPPPPDPAVNAEVDEKQGQSFGELWEDLRRNNEKAVRERKERERERGDWDRDRER